MKRKIFSKLLMGAFLIASVSMFVSCKDYDDDIQKNSDEITFLKNQLTQLQGALTTAQNDLTVAKSAADAAGTAAQNAQAAADAAAKAAQAAQAVADAATSTGSQNATAIKAVEDAQKAAADALTANSEAIEALKAQVAAAAKVDELNAVKAELEDLVAKSTQGLVSEDALAEALKPISAKIDAIDENLNTLTKDIQDLKEWKESIDGKIAAAQQDIKNQADALEAFKNEVNSKTFGLTEEQVKKLLEDYVTAAALQEKLNGYATDANVQTAIKAAIEEALKKYMTTDELNAKFGDYVLASKLTSTLQSYYTSAKIDEILNPLKTDLAQLKTDVAAAQTEAQVKTIANAAAEKVSKALGAEILTLNVFVKRSLTSLVLRPDTYYGGIEGISVYTYVLPEEKNNPEKKNDMYHYFDRVGTLNISDYGTAQYHVNPTYVDLSNFSIDFYNWTANVKEPAATERTTPTRSGEIGISPVYDTTEKLLAANKNNLKDGILSVPFTANAATIEARLKNGIATIASLSMTKKAEKTGVADTTVNSDYAIVVPEYGYGLLIGDNTFPVATRHLDQIGYDGGAVNSSNLHRSFSFLALATTSPTHTIKYDGSFDITAVLESRYVPVKADYDNEITDTAVYVSHSNHQPIARWNGSTLNKTQDGDASIDKAKVVTMTSELFNKLGFKYEIQPVQYTLGTNKTGETVHLELITDANGHVIAYPRNVTADGATIKGKTANAAAVGRQPIVCIMVKDSKDRIVSFAYMKFLITQDVVTPEAKEVDFDIKDIWVNCKDDAGRVTWSEIEYHILDQALDGMSKKDFDNNYIFDYYAQTTQNVDVNGATYSKVTRYGVQYDAKAGKRIDETKAFGSIDEEWNLSAQGTEDATTHIIKWSFTAAQLKDKAEALKNAGKLEDKGDYYVNKEPIVTWVRYAHLVYNPDADKPAVGGKADKGNPSIWVKLTIPAGEFHVAKGDMGANKILTYWYDLNSKTNATGTDDAFEVRVNVPVPVPETSATEATIGYSIDDNATKMKIRYDNLLEEANQQYIASKRSDYKYSEFTKNLKDFFIGGKLSATVKDSKHFNSITGMKLGCEFILPSTTIGNASFNAGTNHGVANSWTVKGYTGAEYTLILNADRTKILIKAKNNTIYATPKELVTLNYDDNTTAADRQITVLNYVNGEDQDDILNYKTHNELDERETFTAYINIKAIDACAPVYWNNMWFNVRFLRPLDLEDPKQALVPDAPNDWHEIDLTDALIVKDWREYYGDRQNRTLGRDVTEPIPGVGTVKAFDFAYYQVELDITDNLYYTDANLGTSTRSNVYTLGQMPRVTSENDAKSKNFIKTADIPNLKLEKISNTKLRYLNNSGVTGGFHVYVPITMTYVYGYQTVRQTKWVTVGVTASVEQAMIEE